MYICTKSKKLKEARNLATLARGQTPWVKGEGYIPSEIEYTFYLSKQLESKTSSSGHNLELIAREINNTYHDGKNVRTAKAINIALWKYDKRH